MLTIRHVTEADVDVLVPLKASLHALHVAHRPDFFKAMKPHKVTTWLRDRLLEDTTAGWLAEDDGVPIGYLLGAWRERPETSYSHPRRWLEIDEIAVDASCRRRGIARALIERCAAEAAEAGVATLELTAWAFNEAAQSVFARTGFEPMLARYALPTSDA